MENQNFRVQYFHDTQGITEIYKNIVSQILGAIQYNTCLIHMVYEYWMDW